VPVLSDAIIVVDPRVSETFKDFTKTFFYANFLAVIASRLVTVAGNP